MASLRPDTSGRTGRDALTALRFAVMWCVPSPSRLWSYELTYNAERSEGQGWKGGRVQGLDRVLQEAPVERKCTYTQAINSCNYIW